MTEKRIHLVVDVPDDKDAEKVLADLEEVAGKNDCSIEWNEIEDLGER